MKNQEESTVLEPTTIALPSEVSVLVEQVSDTKKQEVGALLNEIFKGTDSWMKQVESINVSGVDDKVSMKMAEVARKNAKTARLSAEKMIDAKRLEVQQRMSADVVEDKLWLKTKQIVQITFKAIEEKAQYKEEFEKRFLAEQRELQIQVRINKVSKFAEINRIEFEFMSDDSFESFLAGLEATHNAKIEAERKVEEDRIAKEKADAEAREQQRLENERLKAEAIEREKQIELDRIENELKLEKERQKAKEEKMAIEEKARVEREKIEKEQAEEKAKSDALLAEQKRIADAEAKKQAEMIAKQKAEIEAKEKAEAEAKKLYADKLAKEKAEAEKLAKAPAKKQLTAWLDSLSLGKPPLLNDTVVQIEARFEGFKKWAIGEIEKI